MLSVIVPASNEEAYLGACLDAVIGSDPVEGGAELIVVANGCHDRTADVARGFIGRADTAGWGLKVIELVEGGKIGALNAGDAAASGGVLAYLDADVIVSRPLLAAIARALNAAPGAAYASGDAVIPRAESALTRAYARMWQRLPFAQSVAPGYGLFAVNRAGRARWGEFPSIISDDTFVRLQFAPHERIGVPYTYEWPMVEGWSRLVRVRRRQDAGVAEIAQRWPELMQYEGKERLDIPALVLKDPIGFLVYGAVSVAVRLGKQQKGGWVRGR